jgi:hypothetical protein
MTMKLIETEAPRKVWALEDDTITYLLPFQAQGPASWKELHRLNYGSHPQTDAQLRMQTFPETIRLAGFALENRDCQLYGTQVIQAVVHSFLTGNTLALWTPQGLYGIDFPEDALTEQLEVDNQQVLSEIEQKLNNQLKRRIGEHVQASEDGFVRYASSGAIVFGKQREKEYAVNPGVIVLAGILENARLCAQRSGLNKRHMPEPFFPRLVDSKSFTVRIPRLDQWFNLRCYETDDCDDWCAFGGFNTAPKAHSR